MAMPTGIPVIETFLGFPSRNRKDVYKFLAPHLRDEESKGMSFPAQYMFKDVPADLEDNVDPVAVVLDNLDRFGIERGMIGVGRDHEDAERALTRAPRPLLRQRRGRSRTTAWTRCGSSSTCTRSGTSRR